MVHRIIVASFGDKSAAHRAVEAIRHLNNTAGTDFKLRAGAMVSKDDLGNLSVLDEKDRPPIATVVGASVGALIGLIGGPAGTMLGALVGTGVGVVEDTVAAVFDDDFVDDVVQGMHPGSTSLIIDVDEGSELSIDHIVAEGRGKVFRQIVP